MKTLNLQAAIAGAPIQRRNGEKVTFVAYVPEASFNHRFIFMDDDGIIHALSSHTSEILMTPVFKKHWVNVYRSKSGAPYFGVPFDNESDSAKYANCVSDYIKTISFDIEE